ncbi:MULTISPECIES: extracellular solute-binding protein [unclassified Paenibacillus]|uniref:extracellular solute-binding protein n=1 Tax=unclassified Paenibacillus TaxID=185978 RepID=UPI0030F552C9
MPDTLSFETYFFDLDGTIFLGDVLLPGVQETLCHLRSLNKQVRFLSNTTIRTRGECRDRLLQLGLAAHEEEIVTAGFMSAAYFMESREAVRVLVAGEQALRNELVSVGVETTDDPAQATHVLVGMDREFDYGKLHRAMKAVQQSTELFSLLDMNAIIPLDDFIVKEEGGYLANFYPAFMANSQTDGHTYSIPFQRSTIVLYYNKEMFKEAGLDPEKGPETWEQMQEYAVKLKKDGRYGLEIPVTGFAYWMMQTFALQNGDNLMTPDGKKVMFDTPENVEGLQYWVDLAAKHKATPEGVTDWSTVPSDFLEGKTAMMYHTTGNLSNVKKNATFDFGVSFLPAKKQYGSPTGGGNFYIFKDIAPEKQQAAWEFVKFMTEPERAAQWSIDTGYVAVRKSAYETERMKEYAAGFPAAVVARDQLEYAAAELSTHNNGKVMKILNDSVQAALIGDLTPAGALKKAQAEADQALASFNK